MRSFKTVTVDWGWEGHNPKKNAGDIYQVKKTTILKRGVISKHTLKRAGEDGSRAASKFFEDLGHKNIPTFDYSFGCTN